MEHMGITIDPNRDTLFDELGTLRLKESYMMDDEISPQERFAYVSKTFSSNPEHAQRLYDYVSKHWLSYSTPILSYGRSKRGLPISCYLNFINDTAEGLVENLSETNWLSMLGGGVGIGFGIRSADDKSTGVLPHLKMYDASSLAYRQGRTRRGSYAAYLDISHPDILLFLEMRKPTGDQNFRCLNLHHGINITDDFMQLIENCMTDPECDDTWELKDPHTKEVRETISARDLWQRVLEMRMQTGEPYIHYVDESNRKLPQWLKDIGLSVNQSNLCSEIILPTNKDRTAVCCLSSVNLEYFDEWSKNKQFLRDILEMLDNVLQKFIDEAPDSISRAKFSAMRERSVGVGALGFHAYLQRKGMPFESALAKSANLRMFRYIRKGLDEANKKLGTERGEAPDAEGTGLRCSHVMAIAPNASSSIIMGNTSPSIEPWRANAYRQDTLSGAFLNKNKYLDKLIKDKCDVDDSLNYDKIWSSIIANDGSVQQLRCHR
jgi:ribonucleoside-diphosphate reductase alpha chain